MTFEKHNDFFMNPYKIKTLIQQRLSVLIKESAPFTREFQIYLENVIFKPSGFTGNILKQPMTKNINKKIGDMAIKIRLIMKQGVLLPVHHGLTDGMFMRLHKTINDFLSNF